MRQSRLLPAKQQCMKCLLYLSIIWIHSTHSPLWMILVVLYNSMYLLQSYACHFSRSDPSTL